MPPNLARPDPARGVFETLLVRNERPLELDRHLARLESSLATLFGMPLPSDLSARALEASRGVELGRLRLTLTPDQKGAPEADVSVHTVDPSVVFPPWNRAVSLMVLTVVGGLGAHKWADRRLLETADAEARPALPLLVDRDGSVLEVSRANVFLVKNGAILTPSADGRILAGVTRGRVIELVNGLGITIGEAIVTIDQLQQADEVFLTGSIRGIEPVSSLIGLRDWDAGQITPIVSRALQQLWYAAVGGQTSAPT
jgi:para-aminobenzoate synthetase/4-amino-4-deoxychorismate lyase